MIKKIVICNRCGKVVDKPHPDRITIAKHHVETWKDYWGKERQKSVIRPRNQCTYVANVKLNSMSFGRTRNDNRTTYKPNKIPT